MNGPRTPLDDDEFGYAFDPPFNAPRRDTRGWFARLLAWWRS